MRGVDRDSGVAGAVVMLWGREEAGGEVVRLRRPLGHFLPALQVRLLMSQCALGAVG